MLSSATWGLYREVFEKKGRDQVCMNNNYHVKNLVPSVYKYYSFNVDNEENALFTGT